MKVITEEEFKKRTEEIAKALKIFLPITNNISECFAIYQEVLAEEKRDVFVSTSTMGNKHPVQFKEIDRKCTICGETMKYKPPCCSDKQAWLICRCGYRERPSENFSINSVDGSDH